MHAEHAARKLTIRKNALSGYARFKVRAVDGEWMVKESRSHSKSQLMIFLIICFQYRDTVVSYSECVQWLSPFVLIG